MPSRANQRTADRMPVRGAGVGDWTEDGPRWNAEAQRLVAEFDARHRAVLGGMRADEEEFNEDAA